MSRLILLNKPFQVLSQFTDASHRDTLARFINRPGFYPAGRLDYDSEGLLLLCDDGKLQQQISNPRFKLWKTYHVQLEGDVSPEAINALAAGPTLKDGPTRPAKVRRIPEPKIWAREPPIRQRKNQSTSWVELSINEGRNRQVRRMCASVGFPVLRLIRTHIGDWALGDLTPGQYREVAVHLPKPSLNPQSTQSKSQKSRFRGR